MVAAGYFFVRLKPLTIPPAKPQVYFDYLKKDVADFPGSVFASPIILDYEFHCKPYSSYNVNW